MLQNISMISFPNTIRGKILHVTINRLNISDGSKVFTLIFY